MGAHTSPTLPGLEQGLREACVCHGPGHGHTVHTAAELKAWSPEVCGWASPSLLSTFIPQLSDSQSGAW